MSLPLILTLAIEEKASRFFNALRKMYTPAGTAVTDACLPLFRLLPNDPFVIQKVEELAKEQPLVELRVKEPEHTGSAVIYRLESSALQQIYRRLQQQWRTFLIPQDLQPLEPVITICEQVSPEAASELMALLKENFGTFSTVGTGLQLWESAYDHQVLYKEFPFLLGESAGKTL